MTTSKIGRNDPCFCQSGKKHKKCCLNTRTSKKEDSLITSSRGDEQFSLASNDLVSETQSFVLTTTTSEPFMLIRLYYTIHNKIVLKNRLAALRCVDFDDSYNFVINYHYEAKNIGLDVEYDKIPKKLQPIILAKGKIIDKTSMVIDLRSFERGSCIIEFLNRYISRDIAEITHIATFNKMHKVTRKTAADVMNIDYDILFSEENVHQPNKGIEQLMSDVEHMTSMEERQKSLVDFMSETATKEPILIEKYPVHYYEDGIDSIKVNLKFQQLLAGEHLNGNKSANMHQLISKIIPDVIDDLDIYSE